MDFLNLTDEFNVTALGWGLAIVAAILVGIAKGGVKGIGILIVTLLALAFESKASTGILMPLLMLGDAFAVVYYNRHARWKYLVRLLPWMMIGVIIGAVIGQHLPEKQFKSIMGGIILLSVILMLWWESRERHYVPDNWWFAGLMGTTAGFTTMIGNLAGPFANLFFLAIRLPKNEFIGTTAWLFFLINIFKLPFHLFVWKTVNVSSLLVDLRLMIFVIIGLYIGINVVKRIAEKPFRILILVLTAIGAILIFIK